MKNITSFINESMSTRDLADIEDIIRKIRKLGKYDDLIVKISNSTNDGPNDDVARILNKYDAYMEDVMLLAIDESEYIVDVSKSIKEMAEENERKEGTESAFALDFLGELYNYLS